MKYAIVESGGKQYKAVEGETIEVDRLPMKVGEDIELERVLMMVDGDDISVGMPTVDGIKVNATVVDHVKGPKIIVFKYSPRKRIRVKGGHRQQYTQLMINAIGADGKAAKDKKAEAKPEKKEAAEKKPAAKRTKKAPAKKETTKKAEKAPAKKKTTKSTTKKSSSTKKSEK